MRCSHLGLATLTAMVCGAVLALGPGNGHFCEAMDYGPQVPLFMKASVAMEKAEQTEDWDDWYQRQYDGGQAEPAIDELSQDTADHGDYQYEHDYYDEYGYGYDDNYDDDYAHGEALETPEAYVNEYDEQYGYDSSYYDDSYYDDYDDYDYGYDEYPYGDYDAEYSNEYETYLTENQADTEAQDTDTQNVDAQDTEGEYSYDPAAEYKDDYLEYCDGYEYEHYYAEYGDDFADEVTEESQGEEASAPLIGDYYEFFTELGCPLEDSSYVSDTEDDASYGDYSYEHDDYLYDDAGEDVYRYGEDPAVEEWYQEYWYDEDEPSDSDADHGEATPQANESTDASEAYSEGALYRYGYDATIDDDYSYDDSYRDEAADSDYTYEYSTPAEKYGYAEGLSEESEESQADTTDEAYDDHSYDYGYDDYPYDGEYGYYDEYGYDSGDVYNYEDEYIDTDDIDTYDTGMEADDNPEAYDEYGFGYDDEYGYDSDGNYIYGEDYYNVYGPYDEQDGVMEDAGTEAGGTEAGDEDSHDSQSDAMQNDTTYWEQQYDVAEGASYYAGNAMFAMPQPEDVFLWQPGELLHGDDKELLRTLSQLDQVPSSVRRATLNDYLENIGPEAVDFVRQFEDATGIDSLGMADDLPAAAVMLAAYRMVERAGMSKEEGVAMLQSGLEYIPADWTEAVAQITRRDRTPLSATTMGRDEMVEVLRGWVSSSLEGLSGTFAVFSRQISDLNHSLMTVGRRDTHHLDDESVQRDWF